MKDATNYNFEESERCKLQLSGARINPGKMKKQLSGKWKIEIYNFRENERCKKTTVGKMKDVENYNLQGGIISDERCKTLQLWWKSKM